MGFAISTASTPIRIRSFVATIRPLDAPVESLRPLATGDSTADWLTLHFGALRIWCRPQPGIDATWDNHLFLLGDDAEWEVGEEAGSGLPPMANAVPLRVDATEGVLAIQTSIVGLPPVFIHNGPQGLAVASDLLSLAALQHIRLSLDPVAVRELAQIGHPVGHRTLFRDTTLVPAASRLSLGPKGVRVERTWQIPEARPSTWDQYIDAQIDAFLEATRRLDLSKTFMSLTAGLDTRTIFAALAHQARLIPSVTMSGPRPSLDARTASKLCRAYQVPHRIVSLGDGFTRHMPKYVEQASRLTGGLGAVEQAFEVYLYDELKDEFSARLSGNLGNQIGRCGTEGWSVCHADTSVLSRDFAVAGADAPDETAHWKLDQLKSNGCSPVEFILQQEVPFTLVGNFTLGNYYAIQQTPYSNRTVVETLRLCPNNAWSEGVSAWKMRARDLRHRFLGEPAAVSFQRSFLQRIGGLAARYPVNLGWRATGGVSVAGLALGSATLLGLALERAQIADEYRGGAIMPAILALHNFHKPDAWLRHYLREFSCDTLGSQAVRETGIFDEVRVRRVIQDHFGGRKDYTETVRFALNIAMADRFFCSSRTA